MRASRGLKWENKMYKPKRSIAWANIGKSSEDFGSTLGQLRKSSSFFPAVRLR